MAFVGILLQIKLLFEPLVIQFVWYILKQLFTLVSVKAVDVKVKCIPTGIQLRSCCPHAVFVCLFAFAVPKFRSCHKAIMVATGRAHCIHNCNKTLMYVPSGN